MGRKTKLTRRRREPKGISTVILMTVIGAFVIAPIGFLGAEIARFYLCKEQVKACVESAALAAACANASSNISTNATQGTVTLTPQQQTHILAEQYAMNMLTFNSILNSPLTTSNCTQATSQTQQAGANKFIAYLQWLNAAGTPVSQTDPTGKILQINGAWGYVPVFCRILGADSVIGPFQATESANGGLPMLDVILCFDMSSSMDDFSMIALVNRFKASNVAAQVATGAAGSPYPINDGMETSYAGTNSIGIGYQYYALSQNTAKSLNSNAYNGATSMLGGFGHLYDQTSCTWALGSSMNVGYPQSLDAGYYTTSATGTPVHQTNNTESNYVVQEAYRLGAGLPNLNSSASYKVGTIPEFTDMVCVPGYNLNFIQGAIQPSSLQACTITTSTGSFTFPAGYAGIWVALEAARGNLESTTLANTAGVNLTKFSNAGFSGCAPGWQAAYQQMQQDFTHAQPIGNAMQAAANFYTIMNNDCDSHFGMICFASGFATSSSGTLNDNPPLWGSGLGTPTGTNGYTSPYVNIALQQGTTTASSNYTQVMSAVAATGSGGQPLVANGGTDIADTLNAAHTELMGSGVRTGTHKAIVLFTDGLPNYGSDSWNGSSESYPASLAAAQSCAVDGIPVYTIGLCMPTGTSSTVNLQSIQQTVLTDQNSQGLAGASAGGQFFQVTDPNPAALNIAFENVARALVQLVSL